MSREKKAQIIDNLQESLAKCNVGILTDYRGLSTPELTILRKKLRGLGIEYRVTKNTLASLAAERAGRNDLTGYFEGPVAIAFGYGDITEPAKALVDYINTSKASLSIKGGFLAGRTLTIEEAMSLAKLPPREILLAKVLGGMQSPVTSLVNCLAAPMRGLLITLQARIKQMEEA